MREIARQCELPESTLRVYRDEFEAFLPAVGEGKRRRYPEATQETLRQIAAWKKEGRPSGEILTELQKRKAPQAKAQRRSHDDKLEELLALTRAQASEVASLRAELAQRAKEQGTRRIFFDTAIGEAEAGA